MSLTKLKDGWNNVLKGLGGKRDATTNTTFAPQVFKSINRQQLNDLYTFNPIAQKVVDIIVDDALKDDRVFQFEDANQLEVFEKGLDAYKVDDKIKKALKWSRVFGGAALIIVTKDDTMDKPLVIENLKKGCLSNVIVLDKFDIYSTELNRDPLHPRYLEPEYYQIVKAGERIHYSRVIHLDGGSTTNYNKETLQGWGVSVLEKGWNTILNATTSPDLLLNLLLQSNIDVFKIQGLKDALTSGEDELVMKQLEVIMESKSIFNGVAIDKEDDFINITKNFAGLEQINTMFYQVVASTYDIPFTRFMGTSATGLSATGEGDLSNYYDMINAKRDDYKHIYIKIDKILQYHLFGKDVNITFDWRPLWQMSELERAELENKQSSTDVAYFNIGVVSELDIKARLANDERYPSITAESVEAETKLYSELNEETN